MKTNTLMAVMTVAIIIPLTASACTQVTAAKEIGLTAVEYYCSAGELERQALREQTTTAKGPLVQVNCENLPD